MSSWIIYQSYDIGNIKQQISAKNLSLAQLQGGRKVMHD